MSHACAPGTVVLSSADDDPLPIDRVIVDHYAKLVPDLEEIRVSVVRGGEVVRFVLLRPGRSPASVIPSPP